MKSERDMCDLLAESLEDMLHQLPRPEQVEQMREIERLLWEYSDPGHLRWDSPRKFAADLFLTSWASWPLVQNALQRGEDWNPALHESPLDLVLSLLPSDGHLE
jgi:hypothetical protein